MVVLLTTACKEGQVEINIDDNYGTFYEIFVASFYDGSGDGHGDLQGIIEKIDYLDDTMNVDGLWLMPIMPSPSYHKYDVTNYYEIDPQYGSIDTFKTLAKVTGERDIKLVIDFVVNHSSNLHPWFLEASKSLKIQPCGEAICIHDDLCRDHNPLVKYYNFTDEKGLSDYHQVPNVDGYYYEGRFGPHMPDLNLDNEALRLEILKIGKYWIDLGVDGFRLDAVTHFYEGNNTKNIEFLAWLQKSLAAYRDDIYIVGEAWSDGGTILKLHESEISSFFNFPFATSTGKIIPSIKMKKGKSLAEDMSAWQKSFLAVNPKAIDGVFLSNHDNSRSAGSLNRDLDLQKMGANVYLLMPGNAFIYYGEELGMVGSGKDENKRQPYMWSTADAQGMTMPPLASDDFDQPIDDYKDQLADKESLLNHYKKLTKLRKQYPEISRGEIEAVDLSNDMLCAYQLTWTHGDDQRQVLVVHNFDLAPAHIDVEVLGHYKLVDLLANPEQKDQFNQKDQSLPGLTSVIYELQ